MFIEQRKRIEDLLNKVEDCSRRGHPYDSKAFPYNPRFEDVRLICSNCGAVYKRLPTQEEINEYNSIMKLQIAI